MKVYTVNELKNWRRTAGFDQYQMADALGLSRNGYQKLEAMTDYVLLPRQCLAFETASLRVAIERNDDTLALPAVSRMCRDFVRMEKKNRVLR